MTDNTGYESDSPEENKLIRGLRADLNDALKAVKTAGADAVAEVKRSTLASTLMPEGYEGFADVFASEVDGELDADAATEWLKGRGFVEASPESESNEAAEKAADLERVTDLGGAVAAAGNLTPEDTVMTQLGEVLKPGTPQSLEDVTSAIEALIHG